MNFLKSQGLNSRRKKWGHLPGYNSEIAKNCGFQHFFSFANVSKKFKAVIATYVYASESSRFTLLENDIGYYATTQSLEDISIWK